MFFSRAWAGTLAGLAVIAVSAMAQANIEIKQTVFDSALGAFVIDAKIRESGINLPGDIQEYDIAVKKGLNKISFYADFSYFPGKSEGRSKDFTSCDIITCIFIDFFTRAYKARLSSFEDFSREYSAIYKHASPEQCLEAYDTCQANLDKMKQLLGDTPQFLDELTTLYNEGKALRKKMGFTLGPFFEEAKAGKP